MSQFKMIPPAPHCPWHKAHTSAPPNIDWCEESLCSWIHEPANTWSNLPYLVLGVYLYFIFKNSSSEYKWFAPAMFLMGLFSFIYHASFNFYTQFFDFLGMFFFTIHMFCLNIARIKKEKYSWSLFVFLNILFSLVTVVGYVYQFKFQLLIVFISLGIVGTEIVLAKNSLQKINYRPYYTALVLILVAATFSILDVTRTWCNPQNHFVQGHALWHLFSCASLYFAVVFYRQFESVENTSI